ncbi:LytR/AlgR family response regulator transcription factor [Taibaiella koreensis]|uniref:LytR/AlgR family response regulator transcription factor n=1 Tax=Taibaiella koreensis TaxID=1268548 RepID=UPI000E59AFDD|nr:LytTR family DNA-binding domain-containing protein [Taibaiella koreensis]
MIRCFITDDEAYAVNTLKTYIEQTPGLGWVGSANDGFSALDFIRNNQVDLLFLDIQMPHISGIEVLKLVDVPVILTTAYTEYAIEGFDHGVVDYLLKPIGYSRFLKAIQKAALWLERAAVNKVDTEKEYLFIKGEHKGKQIKIEFGNIIFIESARNNIIFHCEGAKFTAKMPLKEIEGQLPKQLFLRVHNSYIISIKKVVAIEGNLAVLKRLSSDGIRIPVSPSYREQFIRTVTT